MLEVYIASGNLRKSHQGIGQSAEYALQAANDAFTLIATANSDPIEGTTEDQENTRDLVRVVKVDPGLQFLP